MAIARIKSFIDNGLKNVSTPLDRTANLEPQIGIKIAYSPNEKALRVTVIGARHLPQNFGFTRVNSFVVKVKLLPGKEKFETTAKTESWPRWNEEFTISLRKESRSTFGKTKVSEEEIGGSKLVAVTLYAILEDKPLIATGEKKEAAEREKADTSKKRKDGKKRDADDAPSSSSSSSNAASKGKLLGQFFGKTGDKLNEKAAERKERSTEKRRTIGATTIALDPKIFSGKPEKAKHPTDVSTDEIWKPLKPISSGISGADERRESKKGQVEISLCREKGEKDGSGRLILSLIRLRCSLHTMHEHEALKGQMYIKVSAVEGVRVTHFWKSDRFAPCISMNFSSDSARVIAEKSREEDLSCVTFVIKFVSKNKLGKKVTVGHLVIGSDVGGTYGEQWKQAMAKPGQCITKWQAFE